MTRAGAGDSREPVVRVAGRGAVDDDELVALTRSHGGRAERGWWDRIRGHSLGWAAARDGSCALVGFVNIAWDGGDHAFLLDPEVRPNHRHRGLGSELVHVAAEHASDAGCEWLHVDFDPPLAPFDLDACGFVSTPAGLVHLPDLEPRD